MRILALEPYFGGSHRAFLEDWSERSRHEWTIVGLPPRKWKWRMRHAAVTLADETATLASEGRAWDLLFCSDMLNLAEFRGLVAEPIRRLPAVAYFHENQLTYPFRCMQERDLHFGFVNMTTALAADRVWFNSAFHCDDFLAALQQALRKMPDYRLPDAAERIRARSAVQPLGVREIEPRATRLPGPLRVLWAARWEHDKNPDAFFAAVRGLRERGLPFRLSVIGEQFAESPPIFAEARSEFADLIDRWGYQPNRAAYEDALREADVAVSTAEHEFFGVSVIEAIAAGAYPLLPRRLAYPEILSAAHVLDPDTFFYDGSPPALTERLAQLATALAAGDLWSGDSNRARRAVARFFWPKRAGELDTALEQVARDVATP
ncbi:MAG: DUF3524 domain-containing protein [Phycisphaerae bacterium]|jgi:glycosyltransferase involved in cell wall biosynthesis